MTKKVEAEEARQGRTPGRVRYMLLVSTAAAVIALAIIAVVIGF